MRQYILRRLLISIAVLAVVSIIVFTLMHMQPGNPYSSMINPNTSPAVYEQMLQRMGYYDPLPIKYVRWLGRLLHGDLGYSITSGKQVGDLIMDRLGNTLLLTGTSLIISLIVGTILGVWTAFKRNSFFDNLVTLISIICFSIPTFFIGLLLIRIFAFDLRWLPSSGIIDLRSSTDGWGRILDVARHLILPASTLALTQVTFFQRYIRLTMVDILQAEYITAAQAKGMTLSEAVRKHGIKNALIPFFTLLLLQVPSLFSGALVTETIFVWPGIGRLSYDAVSQRDYMVIIGVLMISSVIILVCNLLADILYSLIDKRIQWR